MPSTLGTAPTRLGELLASGIPCLANAGIGDAERLRQVAVLQQGFDVLNDPVVITDGDGTILYANRAMEQQTGFPAAEAIGKKPGILWGGNMPQEFYAEMWRTIKVEKRTFMGEVKNKRRDGTEYWQELHISPVLDQNGAVRFFIGIEPNITEKK